VRVHRKLGIALAAAVASPSLSSGMRSALTIAVPIVPTPVISDGKTMVAFEIHATNTSGTRMDLHRVRIIDGGSGRLLAAYTGEALAKRVKVADAAADALPTSLGVTKSLAIYVEIELPPLGKVPNIGVEVDGRGADGKPFEARSRAERPDPGEVPVLSPPLGRGTWVAVHDPSWARGHRRVFYTLGGRARIPGRYAIDWVGVDEQGRVSHGDPDRPADAVGYGAPVLAGADAMVVAARDGMAEATSIAGNPAHPLGEGGGNYVVLRLTPNRFAFYEHLRPGSITVRAGERVRAGQPIGALGFTGDTTGPHLHLHVADCASPLGCEGVPFTIRNMTEVGRYVSLATLGTQRWQDRNARGSLGPEWPGYNVVVRFPRGEERGERRGAVHLEHGGNSSAG
jgi:murein DD-endopeptidase